MEFLEPSGWWFTWVLLPILIFFARILDQSIGTMRLIFLSKGMKRIAPILGFFEVIIWLLAVGQIMKHLDNWLCYVAYGAGFAMGNYVGMIIEEKLSLGTCIIRVILPSEAPELIQTLNTHNYGLTMVSADGAKGKVKILFSIIRRKDVGGFIEILHTYFPNAFYTIEDVKAAEDGVFRPTPEKSIFAGIASLRKKTK